MIMFYERTQVKTRSQWPTGRNFLTLFSAGPENLPYKHNTYLRRCRSCWVPEGESYQLLVSVPCAAPGLETSPGTIVHLTQPYD